MKNDGPIYLFTWKASCVLYKDDLLLSLFHTGFSFASNRTVWSYHEQLFLEPSFLGLRFVFLRNTSHGKCCMFLSRNLVSLESSQDLRLGRILHWGHCMWAGRENSSWLVLYQSTIAKWHLPKSRLNQVVLVSRLCLRVWLRSHWCGDRWGMQHHSYFPSEE